MNIQSYQIDNVLNVYRRQLSQGKTNALPKNSADGAKDESQAASSSGNSQIIMEKVADTVLKKITNIDPQSDLGQEMLNQTRSADGDSQWVEEKNEFVFTTIAENNQKETRSITVDDSQTLMRRLDDLAKAAITSKSEKNN